MADKIVSILRFPESSLGMHPATVAANALLIALLLALLLAILAAFLFLKLKSAREIIEQLGTRLGYEPPFGDGAEIFDEEYRKEIVDRGKDKKVELLEHQLGELKTEEQNKDSNLKALQQRAKELEDQLPEANEQAQAHQKAMEQLEQRMRDMQAESDANVAAAQQRSKELEEQLQQAILRSDKVAALGKDKAQAHQKAVEQFEHRMREMEALKIADLMASQRRLKDLEEQLKQATLQNEKMTLQAGEHVHTHQIAVEQLEQRVAESDAKLTSLQQRSTELEEQAQLAAIRQNRITAEAAEQVQAYRVTVDKLEQRMREMEAEGNANLPAHQQRLKELEDQLRQATDRHETVKAQAEEQAQAHRKTVEQFEHRMREMEALKIADLTASQRRLKDLEEQLKQATLQNEQITLQADEHVHTHRIVVEQFEQRVAESDAKLTSLQQRSTELEEQAQLAAIRQDRITAEAAEQVQAYRVTVDKLEQRMREMEAERNANLPAHQQRLKELEDQLRQATDRHETVKAQAEEQAQAHRKTVEQLEQRMREMEALKIADLTASQRRLKDLEEQLKQATLQNEKMTLQADEHVHTHRIAVEQFEQRVAASDAKLTSLQQRSTELEEQAQLAAIRQDRITAEATEQVQAYRVTVNKLEQRMREMEAEGNATLPAHQQRLKELEDQLRQATDRHETVKAQAEEQAQAHRKTVEQLDQRMREMEFESNAKQAADQQRLKELEDQWRQAVDRHDAARAQAEEQALAHRTTVEQLEQRMRAIEANSTAELDGLRQQSKELEDQLLRTNLKNESEKSSRHQESLERNARMKQLAQRIRDLESERDAGESHPQTLKAQVKELEDQRQQDAGQMTVEKVGVNASEQLLRRAEWITARAVGTLLPHGLVAAEASASAALAANPQSIDAAQLLAELARIRRAYPEGLPPVAEAVATFDERAAAFFAPGQSWAAEIADVEAQRRYRAGLNRSALLTVNMALDLRQPTGVANSPATLRLLEMKSSLLARLGDNATTSNAAPRVVS